MITELTGVYAEFLGYLRLPKTWMATGGRRAEGKRSHFSDSSTAKAQYPAT